MASSDLVRQWFVPGDGIERQVISARIQFFLGNDATVRPGRNEEGVDGFWIKAYRNLTSAMISDLQAQSARWRQEQRANSTRDPYVESSTFRESNSGGRNQLPERSSPSVDNPYGIPPQNRSRRTGDSRQHDKRNMDPMQIDPMSGPPPDRRNQQSGYGHPPDNSGYHQGGRGSMQDPRMYQQDAPIYDQYGRPMPPNPYAQDPRYAPMYPPGNVPPPGYGGQGHNGYPPSAPGYQQGNGMGYGRPDVPPFPSGPYPPSQPPPGRESRERDPPRYHQDYQDPRYNYPSPATTIASVANRDRDNVVSPAAQTSQYAMGYDPYGNPIFPPSDTRFPPNPSDRERERERDRKGDRERDDERDSRRRRMH